MPPLISLPKAYPFLNGRVNIFSYSFLLFIMPCRHQNFVSQIFDLAPIYMPPIINFSAFFISYYTTVTSVINSI